MAIKHSFVSAKADGTDATQIQPSNWNSAHLIDTPTALSGGSGVLLGTDASNFLTLDGVKATAALQYLRRTSANAAFEFAAFPFLISTDFDFTHQAPAESLSPSSRSFTLTPVPLGINGTNTLHYLAIYNNAGTFQEAVLITGGTATSGAASGTIIVSSISGTYATGAYKIGTATAGIQEAINSVTGMNPITTNSVSPVKILIPRGLFDCYATVSAANFTDISGSGASSTVVRKNFANGDLFYLGESAGLHGISQYFGNMQLRIGPGITDTSGYAIHAQLRYSPVIENVFIYGNGIGKIKNAIFIESCLSAQISNVIAFIISGRGLEIAGTGGNQTSVYLTNVSICAAGNTTDIMLYIHGLVLSCTFTGFQCQGGAYGIYCVPANGEYFHESQFTNTVVDSPYVTGVLFGGATGGDIYDIQFSNFTINSIVTAVSPLGIVLDTSAGGTIEEIWFTAGRVGVGSVSHVGTAVYISGANEVYFLCVKIMGAGQGSGDTALQIVGNTKNIQFASCPIGFDYLGSAANNGNSGAYRGLYCPSGTHTNLSFIGCKFYGSASGATFAGVYVRLNLSGCTFDPASSVPLGGGGSGSVTGILLPTGLYATLPAAAAMFTGAEAVVSDSNTAVWGAAIAGGGANVVKAFCNGTNWTVVGK